VKGEEKQKSEENELPTIDKTKKKQFKKFLEAKVEHSIFNKCKVIADYFLSIYDFQFLSVSTRCIYSINPVSLKYFSWHALWLLLIW
jgi:hypothetical protein